MAAEMTTLLDHGQRFEPRGRGNLRLNTEIAVSAFRDAARAWRT